MSRRIRPLIARGATVLLVAGAGAAAGAATSGHATESAGATTSTDVVARRIVIGSSPTAVKLLAIPGLGVLQVQCPAGTSTAFIGYRNTTSGPVDLWTDQQSAEGEMHGEVVRAGEARNVATFSAGNVRGTRLDLGQGNSPGPRRAATVALAVYRGGTNAPCGFQAVATTWRTAG